MTPLATLPTVSVEIGLIDESPLNPRTHWLRIEELAASLRANGQYDAVTLRLHPKSPGRYEMANGARRLRAARLAGLPTLAAKVADLSDAEMLDIILTTGGEGNVEPLTALEEAKAFDDARRLLGLTYEQVASRYGRDRTLVHRRLSLLGLPPKAREALECGVLPQQTAFRIARVPGMAGRIEATEMALNSKLYDGVMPERALGAWIAEHLCKSLRGAIFETDDAALVPDAGPCTTCPFRAGNDRETYGDMDASMCMAPECYARKRAAHRLLTSKKESKPLLADDVNAEVFPKGEVGLSWKSDYVALTRPVAAEMLKSEVTRAPTWKELIADAKMQPVVMLGFDQHDHAVDLIKLSDALAAVPEEEVAIFDEALLRKHGRVKARAGSAAAEKAAVQSARERESDARNADEKARRQQAVKDKAAARFLEDFGHAIMPSEDRPFFWTQYAFWSLQFDLAMAALSDADVDFIGKFLLAVDDPTKAMLIAHAGSLDGVGLAVFTIQIQLVPPLRAEGSAGPLAKAWHEAAGNEKDEPTTAPAERTL